MAADNEKYIQFLTAILNRSVEMQTFMGHIRLGVIFGCGAVGAAISAFLIQKYVLTSLTIFGVICVISWNCDKSFRLFLYKWRKVSQNIIDHYADFVLNGKTKNKEELIYLANYADFGEDKNNKNDWSTYLLRFFIIWFYISVVGIVVSDTEIADTIRANFLYKLLRYIVAIIFDFSIEPN